MEKREKLLDEIACLAYGLYEQRGRTHGYALEDWLEAERIVMERRSGEIEREAEAITAGRKAKATGTTKTGQTKKPAAKKKAAAPGTAKKKTATGKKAVKKTE
jgi:topoisomerase IA-like protein